MAKLVACQMVSSPDVHTNLDTVRRLVAQQQPGDLVVLPECFACFGASDKYLLSVAEKKGEGQIQTCLSQLAKQYGVWIVAGTVPLRCEDQQKYTASCLIYNDQGDCVEEYQKIHLFDVQVQDTTRNYKESKYTQAGSRLVVVDSPFGKLGIAVCYDVRFAGLFQAMGQIDVLALPAAFTQTTGEAHWHALLRARAIEKQCYLVAAGQGGKHENGRETYGHSCVISPWGTISEEIQKGEGAISAHFDKSEITRIRASMPVHEHNQFRSYLV
ncbi:carbon-nitrogen hydrolase family protein [Aliiglaciecola litoralis]|uniref:Carbon-nitrogen hydrolase family protein n=1 Tax=Aliiglaciecola litoralis TaxID=582857 RepID=A0ABN1LIR0_9ALTE